MCIAIWELLLHPQHCTISLPHRHSLLASITPPIPTRYIRSLCLLYVSIMTSLNTVSFPFGMIFNYIWMPSSQSRNIISLPSAHVQSGQIQRQSMFKLKTGLSIHVQNITYNLNKLLLHHKPTIINWQDRQTWTNCLFPLYASRVGWLKKNKKINKL